MQKFAAGQLGETRRMPGQSSTLTPHSNATHPRSPQGNMDSPSMLVVVSLAMALSATGLLAKSKENNSTTTSAGTFTTTKPLLTVYRSENYTTGESVNLSCTNKTWREMSYTTWEIPKNGNYCRIAAGTNGPPHDMCLDGKVIRNTTKGESYLHIPFFNNADEGIYKCETAIFGDASYSAFITVSAIVSPKITTRLESRDGKREAVCEAAGGKPAASISWKNTWNSNVTQNLKNNPDGSVTVESRLILPKSINAGNLSCIVFHPGIGFPETHSFKDTLEKTEELKWIWIIALGSISFITAILTGLYIMRNHLGKLRNCWKSKIPAPPPPKTPQVQDVEEVEPYASYVQRINSIYNSSAELCNA